MCKIVPFKKEHLEPLMLEKLNANLPQWIRLGRAEQMEKLDSHTVIIDGEVMMCFGFVEHWEGRAGLWNFFSEKSAKHPVAIYRAFKRALDSRPYKRIEVSVPRSFPSAIKRAKLLGFEVECEVARSYFPNGEDSTLLARVVT